MFSVSFRQRLVDRVKSITQKSYLCYQIFTLLESSKELLKILAYHLLWRIIETLK